MVCKNVLYDALDVMVTWTQQVKKPNGPCWKCRFNQYSNLSFLKEFATIKFCLPRASGHTTIAKRLYQEKFKTNAIIVVPFERVKDNFEGLDQVHHFDRLINLEFNRIKYTESKFEAIIVDCSSMFTQSQIANFYRFVVDVCYRRDLEDFPIIIFLQ